MDSLSYVASARNYETMGRFFTLYPRIIQFGRMMDLRSTFIGTDRPTIVPIIGRVALESVFPKFPV